MSDARPGRDHILVSGLGKTGTSGVYTSVRTGLTKAGHDARTFFEPSPVEILHECFRHAPDVPVLTKIILQELVRSDLPPRAFDRRVMTVRDPRDTAISVLLFRPLIATVLRRLPDADLEQFLDALRQKERDPSSVSVVQLYRLSAQLGMGARPKRLMVDILQTQQEMVDSGGFHIVRYEDFIAGRLDALSDYLGFQVENVSTQGSSVYGHTSRSEGSGSFRDWFTPSDVAFFDRRWGRFLDRLGYSREVELSVAPVIDPAISSEYVRANFHRRRDSLKTRSDSIERAGSGDDAATVYARLSDRSDAGDIRASVHAAELALSGGLGARQVDDALRFARLAAEAGSEPGMQLLVDLLANAQDPATVREWLGWRQELHARQSDADHRLAAELSETRASTSYQLGRALVRAAKSPRRDGVAAARTSARLWRDRTR